MQKIFKVSAMVTIFLTTMLALAFTAGAGIGGASLSPTELPANQAEGAAINVFDLMVEPGQNQTISVSVTNSRETPISVELALNSASMSRTGSMIYSVAQPVVDDSMEFLIGELITFPNGESEIVVEIPARTTAQVPMTINIPNQGFDGMIIGAVHSMIGVTEAERAAGGGMIMNRFANVMPIRLRISDVPVEPDFALGEVYVDSISHRPAYIAYIHNISPRRSRHALTSLWIYPVGGDRPVIYHENQRTDFAPNAVFLFTMFDRARYGIFPGDYIARVRVEYDGQIWNFEQEFTVTAAAARSVAERAIGQGHMLDIIGPAGPSPLVIGLVALAVLLLLAFGYMVWKNKKNQAAMQAAMPVPANAAPQAPPVQPAATATGGAIDKLKGMDEEKLTKVLEQMQKQEENNQE